MANIIQRVQSAIRGFSNPNDYSNNIILPSAGEQKEFPLPIVWSLVSPGRYDFSLIDYASYVREGYSQNAVLYSAIKYKNDSISQAPLRAYKGNPNKARLIEDNKHPLAQLANRPNDYMSKVEYMQYCVTYLNIHGNCFIYWTGFDSKKVVPGLYPLRPDRVKIVPDSDKKVVGYMYYPDGLSVENARPILRENMLHIKFPNPYDPLEGQGYGLSPMSAAATSIDTDNYMTKFLGMYFQRNGIMPGGIIELPYESNMEDIAKLREQWLDTYGGASNWGKPMVLDSSGKWVNGSMAFKDMVLDAIDLRNIRRTTAVLGVPAKVLGLDNESSTYNNLAEADAMFWQHTMSSELQLFEEEMSLKVKYKDEEAFLRFDISGIAAFAEDTTSQVANYVQLVQHFVPPIEAARVAGLDIEQIPNGDIAFMPSSLIPVEQGIKPPKPIVAPKLPFGNQGNEDETGDNPDEEAANPEIDTDEEPKARHNHGHRHKAPNEKGLYQLKGKNLEGFETKDRAANSQIKIAEKYEPHLEAAAMKRFEADKKEVMKRFRAAQKAYTKQKKSFDWNDFENSVRLYLFIQGRQEWTYEFIPWFFELAWDARDDWIERMNMREENPHVDFDLIFLSRASIEGEAWFADYSIRFAQAIQETTHEGIHAVIRDGMAEGFGTDKIGKKIELLFDQYMSGSTSPEDWAFMQERMPAWRTEMIARTETHGAMSASNNAFFQRTGATKREWWSTNDDRTRESHVQAWNRYSEGGSIGPIPFSEKFIVGGAEMRYPGDKSAPIAQWIQCRCLELPYYEKG